jgi:hypothetical protein
MYYKVLAEDGAAFHGGTGVWREGVWRSVRSDLVPCKRGLHLCREQDLIRWLGPVIWEAEVHPDATIIEAEDKIVVSKARIVRRVDAWDERSARLFAVDCAEAVVHFCGNDPRPREAIAVTRRFAIGEATKEELDAARDAARDAAWAAAMDAAWAAAMDAAWAAARDAAWDAARDAARAAAWAAAWDAARRDAAWAAAMDAAWDAARDAAWAAAWAAAWDAAKRDAAWAAAWAAARATQTTLLMRYLYPED